MIACKLEIQKCGQILCVNKPCFLMPGHIYIVSLDDSLELSLYVYSDIINKSGYVYF